MCIKKIEKLLPPVALLADHPLTDNTMARIINHRQRIHHILEGRDDRMLVVVGPCSIHDTAAALEYAERLLKLRVRFSDQLEIIMRVYFEKPRTTVGWKGLINDPFMDNSFQVNEGLYTARKLLLDINQMGMPAATEFLDLITPQYLADLISWGAIGARTTGSQIHRELASGLPCPIGFKNGTDGSIDVAIDAVNTARVSHHCLSITKMGDLAIVKTEGNKDTHIILRGGKRPNYHTDYVKKTKNALITAKLVPNIMIDFSHANSGKQYKKQLAVGADVCQQISAGEKAIIGVMIESHLIEGMQQVKNKTELVYGQSVTDGCIGWQDTDSLLSQLSAAVKARHLSFRT